MSKLIQLRKEYRKILKNFSGLEFKRSFTDLFGREKWNDILKTFPKQQINTKSEADRAVAIAVEEANEEFLQRMRNGLQLLDVLLHSKRKKWYAFKLCGERSRTVLSDRKVEEEIKILTSKLKQRYDVKVKAHEEIFWIRMSPKLKERAHAIFFAYLACEDVILSTRRNPAKNILQAIVSALKFENYKKVSLEGNDVWSLFKMMEQKEGRAVEMKIDRRIQGKVHRKELGVGKTKQYERKSEMEDCLDLYHPVVQSLEIKSETGFRVKRWLPEMEGIPVKTVVRVKHPNMMEFFKRLVESNIITDPSFYESLLATGKNQITLKDPSLRK